jgi:hypothetical protein
MSRNICSNIDRIRLQPTPALTPADRSANIRKDRMRRELAAIKAVEAEIAPLVGLQVKLKVLKGLFKADYPEQARLVKD